METKSGIWKIGIFFLFVFFCAGVPCAFSQADLVEKININAISKISVQDNLLLVYVKIENQHDQAVKLENGRLEFHFGAIDKYAVTIDDNPKIPVRLIGTQMEFASETIGANATVEQEFVLDMGENALSSLSHIINCIGNPKEIKPFVEVKGTFELAILTSRGSTTHRDLGISWKFAAQTPEKVDLFSAAQP